ncbi:hypothetical protein, partial [Pseudomonas sp. 2822-17]|uniref:hypothetical protein n=1 Tax=Pseudomonas sp. 2822-17 TaxID=1712678 RepID=UPI001C44F9E3
MTDKGNKRTAGASLKKIRFNLQVKLTIFIVILLFLIISLRTVVLEFANNFIEMTLVLNIVSAAVGILL